MPEDPLLQPIAQAGLSAPIARYSNVRIAGFAGHAWSATYHFANVHSSTRARGAATVTRNDILTGLNKPDDFILAIVEIGDEGPKEPIYVRYPFQREPDFGVTSVNYDLRELLAKGRPAGEDIT